MKYLILPFFEINFLSFEFHFSKNLNEFVGSGKKIRWMEVPAPSFVEFEKKIIEKLSKKKLG